MIDRGKHRRRGTPSENWKLDECLVIGRGCTGSSPIYSVDSAGARFQSGLDRRGSGGNSTDPTNPLTLLNRNSEKQTVEWEMKSVSATKIERQILRSRKPIFTLSETLINYPSNESPKWLKTRIDTRIWFEISESLKNFKSFDTLSIPKSFIIFKNNIRLFIGNHWSNFAVLFSIAYR